MKILTPEQSQKLLEQDIEAAEARHRRRISKYAETHTEFKPRGFSPAEKRCLDAANLRSRENLTLQELGQRLGVSTSRANQLCLRAKRIEERPQARVELTTRTYYCLLNRLHPAKEVTPEAVATLGQKKLLEIPNFGPHSLTEVMQWLHSKGFGLNP